MSKVRLTGSTSGYAEITAPAIAGNNTVTLPSTNGSANQLLKNGATPGILEYSTVSIGSTGELDNIASINGGPLAGFRNRIINGNFDIWQRGTSFSNPADGAYTADRWVVFYNGSGATRTISQQIFDPGAAQEFFLRHAQTVAGSGGTYNVVNQRIENVRTYGGETVTISFFARGTSASLTLPAIQLRQGFGAGGSADVFTTMASSVVIAATNFAKYTYTVAVPSIAGKTIGTSSFLELSFALPTNATFSFDIASVQLEPGSVATPFEHRPIGTELALCQRYYESGDIILLQTVSNIAQILPFSTRKRATPPNLTLTYGSGSGGTIAAIGGQGIFQDANHSTYTGSNLWTASAEL